MRREIPKCQWCGGWLDMRASDRYAKCGKCKGYTFNPARLSFADTTVTPQRTLVKIIELFDRFKPLVSSYQIAKDPDSGRAGVEFVVRMRYSQEQTNERGDVVKTWRDGGMRVRFLLPMPEQADRLFWQRWRLVYNWLENTLESIAVGAFRAEDAFLSYVMGRLGGTEGTLGDHLRHALPQGRVDLPIFAEPVQIETRLLTNGREGEE